MYASQGKYADALRSLAQDAYYCSLDLGPDSVATAGAYFHMGGAFLAQVIVFVWLGVSPWSLGCPWFFPFF